MTDVLAIVLLLIVLAFLMSMSIQLQRIIRLLFVIASKQDYVAACKAIGKE